MAQIFQTAGDFAFSIFCFPALGVYPSICVVIKGLSLSLKQFTRIYCERHKEEQVVQPRGKVQYISWFHNCLPLHLFYESLAFKIAPLFWGVSHPKTISLVSVCLAKVIVLDKNTVQG